MLIFRLIYGALLCPGRSVSQKAMITLTRRLYRFQTADVALIRLAVPDGHYCLSSQQGETLDLSGGAFSLEEDGSLYLVSPGANESGEFVCTATNAAGYSSRKVQLTVYG